MKKNKFIVFVLAIVMGASALAGCSNDDTNPNHLTIEAVNAGYGLEWLYALKDEYLKINTDKSIDIKEVDGKSENTRFITPLLAGTTATDIYFGTQGPGKYAYTGYTINGTYYDRVIEDLSGLYDTEIPGEGETLEKKMDETTLYYASQNVDGKEKQYVLPWVASTSGFLYNLDVWPSDIELPLTTNEMIETCAELKSRGIVPFVYSYDDPYWNTDVWIAQYEGVKGFRDIWAGYAANGERYVSSLLLRDGILETLRVMEQLVSAKNGFTHPDSFSLSFTASQNYLLDAEYNVAMMPNGDWIRREMSGNYDPSELNVQFMKTPVISAIVNRTPSVKARAAELGKTNDKMLAEIIAAIDNGATEYEKIDPADFAIIKEARSIVPTVTGKHVAYIPVYSQQKDLAKDFLLFMVSDKGMEIFTKATEGLTQPYDYDYLNSEATKQYMDEFATNCYERFHDSIKVQSYMRQDKIYYSGGLTLLDNYNIGWMEAFTAAEDKANYRSADELFRLNYQSADESWDRILTLAGLK